MPKSPLQRYWERLRQHWQQEIESEVRGFGSFSLNYRPPRTGRNPKTGEKVAVLGNYAPHFKAGKELRECVEQHLGEGAQQ